MIREAQQEQQLSSLAAGPWVEDVGFGTQKGGKHGWEIPKYMSMFIGKNIIYTWLLVVNSNCLWNTSTNMCVGKTNLNDSWVHTSMFVGWNHVLLASIVLTCKSSFSEGKTLSCWWKESQGLDHQFIMDSNVHAVFLNHHTISSFISVNISPYYPHAILLLLKSISSPPFCPKKSFDHPISHSPHSSQSHLIPISRSWSELLECPCLSSVADSQ